MITVEGGVRWGDGQETWGSEQSVCVECPFSVWRAADAAADAHTQSHAAGMGCYNVTHGEDPHLTLCWLKHCREGSHIHAQQAHTHTAHTEVCLHTHAHTETCCICILCALQFFFFIFVGTISASVWDLSTFLFLLTCLAFCTQASLRPCLHLSLCISLWAYLPVKTISENGEQAILFSCTWLFL